MAVLDPSELSYAQLVGQYFLAQRGRGLVLSAADLELVQRWEAAGVPLRVVCAGIKEAFEAHRRRHGEQARTPSSLAYCNKSVDRAVAAWQDGLVGARTTPAGGAGPAAEPAAPAGDRSRRGRRENP